MCFRRVFGRRIGVRSQWCYSRKLKCRKRCLFNRRDFLNGFGRLDVRKIALQFTGWRKPIGSSIPLRIRRTRLDCSRIRVIFPIGRMSSQAGLILRHLHWRVAQDTVLLLRAKRIGRLPSRTLAMTAFRALPNSMEIVLRSFVRPFHGTSLQIIVRSKACGGRNRRVTRFAQLPRKRAPQYRQAREANPPFQRCFYRQY